MLETSKIAFVFPGQGSQQPGMGKELSSEFASARAIFDKADEILGRSIKSLCLEGTEEELRKTSNTQPALFTVSAAALAVLREQGVEGSVTAGHSLGEYGALYAAGALDFETALRLVDLRGHAMEEAGRHRPGTMAALLGLDPAKAEAVCAEATGAGVVVPANFNNSMQLVISGEEAGVDRALELAKAAGCKKGTKLNVGGAFHSPLMSEAAEKLAAALADAVISAPRLKFVANVTADFISDPEAIRSELALQVTRCVRWSESVERMHSDGVTHFIEVGPGSVLTGLLKRIQSTAIGVGFGAPGDLQKVRDTLA